MSRPKPRPEDGPGANGLRGGRNSYSTKTALVGSWLEAHASTEQGYKRGFTTNDFQTEAQHAQLGATLKSSPYFGAGIVIPAPKINTKDSYQSSTTVKTDQWKTTYKTMLEESRKITSSRPTPKCNVSSEFLTEYRANWTVDSELSSKLRFETESNRANNFLSSNFKVEKLRMLPGTPKSLERLRELVIEKYGILGITIARYHLGTGIQSCDLFLESVNKLGVKLTQAQNNQLLAYFTSSDEINIDTFFRSFIGKVDGFDSTLPNRIFDSVDVLTLEEIDAKLDLSYFPELVEGLRRHIVVYSVNGSSMSAEGFTLMHTDFYNSEPIHYPEAISHLWL